MLIVRLGCSFKDDFDALVKSYSALRVAHVLCETEPGFACTVGRINSEVIKTKFRIIGQENFIFVVLHKWWKQCVKC